MQLIMNFIHRIKKNVLKPALFWVIMNVVLVDSAFAADDSLLKNPIKAESFSELIGNIAKAAAKIGVPIAAIFIIYSGLLFVTARGSEDKINKAKTTFLWAVVGAAVLLGAWVIANAIVGTVEKF
jgi:hypothetical protein